MADENAGDEIIKLIREAQIKFLDLLISLEKNNWEKRVEWKKRKKEISDGGNLLRGKEIYSEKKYFSDQKILWQKTKEREEYLSTILLKKLLRLTQNKEIEWKRFDRKEFRCSICPTKKNEITLGIKKDFSGDIILRVYSIGSEKDLCGDFLFLFLFPLTSDTLQNKILFLKILFWKNFTMKWKS